MLSHIQELQLESSVLVPAGNYLVAVGGQSFEVAINSFRIARAVLTTNEVAAVVTSLPTPNLDGVYRFVNEVNEHLGYERKGDRLTSSEDRKDLPAVGLTWFGAVAIAAELGGRLPTEAEWEIAGRSGLTQDRWVEICIADKCEGVSSIPDHSLSGQLTPWGLADIYGNVRQWCSDWFHPDHPYPSTRQVQIPAECRVMRVVRGSSYNRSKLDQRSDVRAGKWPYHGGDATAVRLVFDC